MGYSMNGREEWREGRKGKERKGDAEPGYVVELVE